MAEKPYKNIDYNKLSLTELEKIYNQKKKK